jgi:hypothetical protein
MVVVLLITANVLAKQKSIGEDVNDMKKYLDSEKEERKTTT